MKIDDQFVQCAIQAAQDKKALDLTVLDVRRIASFTDSFIICSGTSSPQNQAIADEIHLRLKEQGRAPNHMPSFFCASSRFSERTSTVSVAPNFRASSRR